MLASERILALLHNLQGPSLWEGRGGRGGRERGEGERRGREEKERGEEREREEEERERREEREEIGRNVVSMSGPYEHTGLSNMAASKGH